MFKKAILGSALLSLLVISGCASVPMASKEADMALKKFEAPAGDNAGLYIYRDTVVGQALKKTVSVDDKVVGETANKVYFYKLLTPGQHKVSTESEFSDNFIMLDAVSGKNYFVEQYIKMGVFVGGANVKQVDEAEGKKAVKNCKLAK